jgi:hypothetical protein
VNDEYTVRILGKPWTYRHVPAQLGEDLFGHFDARRCEVHIFGEQDPAQEADTILHETLHAIDFTLNLGLSEHQVHALAGALYALLADNPHLVARLLQLEVVDAEPDVVAT